MDFGKKLQELRKHRGLTQEELAQALYVSRTAISKWESGRGYPSIDSLKALSGYFGVTIDSLLSGDEILTLAKEDTRQKQVYLQQQVYGLLDCGAVLFFVLPLFGQEIGGAVQAVDLVALTAVSAWLKVVYITVIIGMIGWGILTIVLLAGTQPGGTQTRNRISLLWNATGLLAFIASSQPYGAVLLMVFLAIKVLILSKKQ